MITTSQFKEIEDQLKKDFEELARERSIQAKLAVENKLASIADMVSDKSQEFSTIAANSRIASKEIRISIVKEIIKAADGNLTVFEFAPNGKSKQYYYLYNGKCWCSVPWQKVNDFIGDCCDKMGLQSIYRDDSNFMLKVYENYAHNIARASRAVVPDGVEYVNLNNGTLELYDDGTSRLRGHCREDYLMYCLDYNYDTNADCPRWKAFLNQMLPEKEAQELLAEYIGYGFTDGLKLEKMLALFGDGSNGKSVIMEVVEALLGIGQVSFVSLYDLTVDDEKRSLIEFKLLNISYETKRDIDISVFKRLVSGEPVVCRKLYVGSHIMFNYAKLITSFNQLPSAEVTGGYYRRFILMPFMVTISDKDANVNLPKELCEELSGILNWVLQGLTRLLKNKKFTESPICNEALLEYKRQSNSVHLFISECVEMNFTIGTEGTELFKAYKEYCRDAEIKNPVGRNKFYKRLQSLGAKMTKQDNKIMFDVKLISDDSKAF